MSLTAVARGLASMTVTNTGARDGATVAQLYLASRAGKPVRRLVGYRRVTLAPGASERVSIPIDPRLLADWRDDGWAMPEGLYGFVAGDNAETLGAPVSTRLAARHWHDDPVAHLN